MTVLNDVKQHKNPTEITVHEITATENSTKFPFQSAIIRKWHSISL